MNKENLFKVVSDYQPTGDQPQAIEKLAAGILQGKKSHRESSETYPRHQPQQDAGRPAPRRIQGIFPGQRSGIFCILL